MVERGGARVSVGGRRVVVGSIGYVGIEVDGDGRGLCGRVRGRGESSKVRQLCLGGDHVSDLLIGRTRRGYRVRVVL